MKVVLSRKGFDSANGGEPKSRFADRARVRPLQGQTLSVARLREGQRDGGADGRVPNSLRRDGTLGASGKDVLRDDRTRRLCWSEVQTGGGVP